MGLIEIVIFMEKVSKDNLGQTVFLLLGIEKTKSNKNNLIARLEFKDVVIDFNSLIRLVFLDLDMGQDEIEFRILRSPPA